MFNIENPNSDLGYKFFSFLDNSIRWQRCIVNLNILPDNSYVEDSSLFQMCEYGSPDYLEIWWE